MRCRYGRSGWTARAILAVKRSVNILASSFSSSSLFLAPFRGVSGVLDFSFVISSPPFPHIRFASVCLGAHCGGRSLPVTFDGIERHCHVHFSRGQSIRNAWSLDISEPTWWWFHVTHIRLLVLANAATGHCLYFIHFLTSPYSILLITIVSNLSRSASHSVSIPCVQKHNYSDKIHTTVSSFSGLCSRLHRHPLWSLRHPEPRYPPACPGCTGPLVV